jgi:hypothetical protein
VAAEQAAEAGAGANAGTVPAAAGADAGTVPAASALPASARDHRP